MTVQSMYGLKEWDAQVQLLLSGQYAVLVRKGGIIEKNLEFEIEHREFFLYPTFLHQNKLELKEDHHGLILDQNPPSEVEFAAFARVRAVWKIENLDMALQIEKLQALNSKAIERRFNYRNKPYLHVLLLEVFSLETSFVLSETPEMFGCISWVPLDQVHEVHARPVLPGQQLEALHQQLVDLLGAPQS